MKFTSVFTSGAVLLTALLTINSAVGDTLTLNDGQVITGSFVSRDTENVVFSVGGQQLKFPVASVQNIAMDMGAPAAAPAAAAPVAAPAAVAAPAPAAAPAQVTVPAGTRMMARTVESLNSKKHKEGHRFTARLEADLMAGGVVVAPRGATLYGVLASSKQSGRMAGSSEMSLTFTEILINNQLRPIATTGLKAATDNTAGNTAKKTLGGAALGGLVGGSDDAKRGAKIGLGLSLLTSGNSIDIPSGTILEFELRTPLSI